MTTTQNNLTWQDGLVSRADRERLLGQRGVIVWMTGLSGSGKSTIACRLEQELIARRKLSYRLDGDNVRHGLNKNLGFTADDRVENIRRVGEVAKLFADAGVIVIVSFISPYRKDRDLVRDLHAQAGLPFFEVHMATPIETCEGRDPKGLYKKARAGELKGMTGIDDPYEPPARAELTIDATATGPDQAAALVLAHLRKEGIIGA